MNKYQTRNNWENMNERIWHNTKLEWFVREINKLLINNVHIHF